MIEPTLLSVVYYCTRLSKEEGGLKEEMRSNLLFLLRILECRLMLCAVSLAYSRSPPSWAYSPLSRSMPSTKQPRRCATKVPSCRVCRRTKYKIPNYTTDTGKCQQKRWNSDEPGSGGELLADLFEEVSCSNNSSGQVMKGVFGL